MDEIRERVEMQLRVIDRSYSIKVQNKEDIARIIVEKTSDKRQVLGVCSSLNYWVATNGVKGNVVILQDVALKTLEGL